MKKIFSSLLLLAGLVAATSCAKDETVAPTAMTVTGTFSGSQEAPTATASTATGTFAGSYNPLTRSLTYTVTYSGLTPTAGHFHIGVPGTAGGISLFFPFNNSAGTGFVSPITTTVTLSDGQATALLGNAFYGNLHSTTYPGGEIRANLTAK
jgi:hypothetical protein